jgi:hypothetical protein
MTMFKEYRFEDPAKAIQKRKQLKQEYGYDFPIYKIQLPTEEKTQKEFLAVVYPYGLQPNPKRRK